MNSPLIHNPMLQHADVWRGIDRLAAKHGLSPSGLARRGGLDPTAFNPSKRITREGRPRWPSTESLAKILAVTGESFLGFVQLTGAGNASATGFDQPVTGGRMVTRAAPQRALPIIALDRVANGDCFDDEGKPKGSGWGRLSFGGTADRDAFAVEINGHDFDPVYRDGDVVVVSPAAEVRRGDRVVVGTGNGAVLIRKVGRQDADGLMLEPLVAGNQLQFVDNDQLRWVARILWASQ